MTAFAQARVEQDGWAVRISIRSVNHRFLDLHLRLPEGFELFEPQLRQAVRERVHRGHLDLFLNCESSLPAAVEVKQDVAAAYLGAAEELRKRFALTAEPDLAAILRLPGVIAAPTTVVEHERQRLEGLVRQCVEKALSHLEEMRQSEGRLLQTEMAGRLLRISENTRGIEDLAEQIRPAYARRLQMRLKQLLDEIPVDPARLAQEAALLAERSDITEEIARLRSHIQQFGKLLAGTGEAGKKLDFLLQEMQREANAILSKAPGLESEGVAITNLALEVKAEVEKLREQAQNVE